MMGFPSLNGCRWAVVLFSGDAMAYIVSLLHGSKHCWDQVGVKFQPSKDVLKLSVRLETGKSLRDRLNIQKQTSEFRYSQNWFIGAAQPAVCYHFSAQQILHCWISFEGSALTEKILTSSLAKSGVRKVLLSLRSRMQNSWPHSWKNCEVHRQEWRKGPLYVRMCSKRTKQEWKYRYV